MNSAFGVEHEIAKARQQQPPRLPRSRTAQKLGHFVRVASQKGTKATQTQLSVAGLGRATGRGVFNAGLGTAKLGRTLHSNPGRTGAAVAGIGLTGAGLGYKRAYDRKPPKKAKKVPNL